MGIQMSKYNIRQIYAAMELDLIRSMKRNLVRHLAEEEKHGFKWTQWQARKLASLESYRKRNFKIVEQQSPNIAMDVDRTIRGAFRRGARSVAEAAGKLWNRFGFGRRQDTTRPIPRTDDDSNFFKVNRRRMDTLVSASQGELRTANRAMLRQMDDVYRQTIFKAQVFHNSGAASLGKAIDMATQDFLDKGIDCITYSNGRKVNVASYAEMALRTAAQRAVFAGEGARRDEIGVRTVVVSAHNNCSPLCLPWQGKVYIDDVYSGGKASDGKYPLLSTAMKAGLFHPNCRHNMATFFPGRSKLPEPVDDEMALGNYDAEQKQRYMERQIRKYKRREAGSVDPENEAAALAKVKDWQKKLRGHLAEHDDLRRDSRREQNKLPIEFKLDNGLNNRNKPIIVQKEIVDHASKGEFTNPKNPKKQAVGKFKSGGHGQDNIDLLEQHGIMYNIVKDYDNGVRIGNVPDHKEKLKQNGTKQAWFPKNWSAEEIEKAGRHVADMNDPNQFVLTPKRSNGELIAIYKYGNYNGVTVGVCYDVKKGEVTTIFPDETQRLIGR
jgi:hypothetical protein